MQKSDLKEITPFEAQTHLIEELCHSHYKGDGSQLDKNIEKLWKAMRGTDYYHRKDVPFSLVGGPQTSKTFSFHKAASVFADAVGLDFVSNPDDKMVQDLLKKDAFKHSFVYISHEFAGEMSSLTTAGLPATLDVEGRKYMTNAPLLKFAALEQAAGGVFLCDDLANAGSNVTNALLPLFQFKRVGSLNFEGKYVGSTRNRGSLDGTHTSKTSTALSSRGAQFGVLCSVDGWLEHILPFYEDRPNTTMIIESFMLNHGHDHFYRPPLKAGDQSWPGPRTWANAIETIDCEMNQYEQLVEQGRSFNSILRNIDVHVSGSIGIESGVVFQAHANSFLKGALPCALKQMQTGDLPNDLQRLFDTNVRDKSNTPEGAAFATNYAFALANEASNLVTKSLNDGKDLAKDKAHFQDILKNFVSGVYNKGLHEDKMALSMTKFKDMLVETNQSKKRIGRINDEGMTVVNDEFLSLMTEVVGSNQVARMEHPDIPGVKLYDTTFTDVFSNSSRMERDFERTGTKAIAKEYMDVMSAIDDVIAETPKFSEVGGTRDESSVTVDEFVERIESINEDITHEESVDKGENASDADSVQETVDDLDKVLDEKAVDEFKLQSEQDGVVKKDSLDISDDELNMLDDMLDQAM